MYSEAESLIISSLLAQSLLFSFLPGRGEPLYHIYNGLMAMAATGKHEFTFFFCKPFYKNS